MNINRIQREESTWRYAGNMGGKGAQIDLLIDRVDRSINLCEMKFYTAEFVIDKGYASELKEKIEVFEKVTKTKKTIFVSLVTTYGVKDNNYSKTLVDNSITMEDLFRTV